MGASRQSNPLKSGRDKPFSRKDMSKRAEEATLKAYPEHLTQVWGPLPGGDIFTVDNNTIPRKAYKQGYEQAEKDLTLTWEDIKTIVQILTKDDWYDFEIADKLWSQEFYEEVLRRFKKQKEKE